jgi:hypothetical protein
VGTTNLAEEWDPVAFPRLIVFHSNGFSSEYKNKLRVSFNFHKFRSMMLRIRTGVGGGLHCFSHTHLHA